MKRSVINVYDSEKELEISHNGIGYIQKIRAFHSGDFYTPIDFIDYIEVPPKARIGLHKHQLNEEIYFIISGNGEMNMNGEIKRVKPGDIIVNSVYDTHGLTNDSNENINIFIFQVSSQK